MTVYTIDMNFEAIEKQSHKDHETLELMGFSYGTATELERLLRLERDTPYNVTQSSNCGVTEAILSYPQKSKVEITFTLRHSDKITEYYAKLDAEYKQKVKA